MVYVTGDIHGDTERIRLASKLLRKDDTLIVSGDFGFVWDGSTAEKKFLKQLGKKPFSILFADGLHENFKELSEYPETEFCGGKVRQISGQLYYAVRGEIFTFCETESDKNLRFKSAGKNSDLSVLQPIKVLIFGGDFGIEYPEFYAGKADHPDGIIKSSPSETDAENALDNLASNDFSVDYIVTYDAPEHIGEISEGIQNINSIFSEFSNRVSFNRWYFGKYHMVKPVTKHYFALYDKILPINADAMKFSKEKLKIKQ